MTQLRQLFNESEGFDGLELREFIDRYANEPLDGKFEWKKCFAQRGARTHDPEIKSLMLYRLS